MGEVTVRVVAADLTTEQLKKYLKWDLQPVIGMQTEDGLDFQITELHFQHPDDRNVQTGQFASPEEAASHPDVTVHES